MGLISSQSMQDLSSMFQYSAAPDPPPLRCENNSAATPGTAMAYRHYPDSTTSPPPHQDITLLEGQEDQENGHVLQTTEQGRRPVPQTGMAFPCRHYGVFCNCRDRQN
jgi:hypothetical protein